ncbi:MAG: hypothetical protein Ct9H300mP4_04820 [Gammaproteobacteria bacterium]|nr:MAG: hypothetical protein Ct9H300mP4_04820 [Gammaproteobacteria bacterium]
MILTLTGEQHVDWNTSDIDFEGRGADRGLRGIAFDPMIFISQPVMNFFVTTKLLPSRFLQKPPFKTAHEICRMERAPLKTSTGLIVCSLLSGYQRI